MVYESQHYGMVQCKMRSLAGYGGPPPPAYGAPGYAGAPLGYGYPPAGYTGSPPGFPPAATPDMMAVCPRFSTVCNLRINGQFTLDALNLLARLADDAAAANDDDAAAGGRGAWVT